MHAAEATAVAKYPSGQIVAVARGRPLATHRFDADGEVLPKLLNLRIW
jgi:hypothetical protein